MADAKPEQVEVGLRRMANEFRRNAERSTVALQQNAFAGRAMICDGAANELEMLRRRVRDYAEMHNGHKEMVRRLDVALNGDGAAKQASIVDLVAQFEKVRP